MKHRVIKAAHARRGQKQSQIAEGPDRCQSWVSAVGTVGPIPQRERQCEIETLLILDLISMAEVRESDFHQGEKPTHGSPRTTITGGKR
jgi:hypothetical protein